MKIMQDSKFAVSESLDMRGALRKGADFLASLQYENGCWKGDYGGPMFLLPMYIGACYITGRRISDRERLEFARYLGNAQNRDGSIGLHAEGAGCMFST